MFGKTKPPPIGTLIGEGTVIQGELRFQGGLRIDGEVQGNVLAAGEQTSVLVISERAKVTGQVSAARIIVNGEVCGPLTSTELLELQPKARITGDVRYEALEMQQGATIDGELRPLKAEDKPALIKLAAAG